VNAERALGWAVVDVEPEVFELHDNFREKRCKQAF
jgi:hypothetical protein